MAADRDVVTLGDLIHALRRRWLIGSLVAAGILIVGLLVVAGIAQRFEARAGLALDRSSEAVREVDAQAGAADPESWTNTLREQLLVRGVLEQVINQGGLRLNPVYAEARDPVEILARRVRATTVRNSWYVTVVLEDEDAERARMALESLLKVYLAQQDKLAQDRIRNEIEQLATRIDEANRALAHQQGLERQYREQHGIVVDDAERNPITQRLTILVERQALLEDRLTQAAAVAKQCLAADALTDAHDRREAFLRIERVANAPQVADQVAAGRALQLELDALAAKFAALHPRMIEARSRQATREAQIDQAVTQVRGVILGEEKALQDQRASLAALITKTGDDLATYRADLDHLRLLSRETLSQQQLSNELSQRQAKLRVKAVGDRGAGLQVVEQARVSADPVGTKRTPLGVAVVLVALAAGLVAAVGVDVVGSRLVSPDLVSRHTGRPVLASLPEARDLPLLPPAHLPDPLAEPMRALRQAIQFRAPVGCHVITIVSAIAGEGRTTVAARLARSFAAGGAGTLLVDADVRDAGLSDALGLAAAQGFRDLLAGQPGIAPLDPGLEPNLLLLPGGTRYDNPGDLLHSHCLAEWVTQARAAADVIVFDSPPLAEAADALVLCGLSDSILLVVDLTVAASGPLDDALARLGPLRERLLGIVCNRWQGGRSTFAPAAADPVQAG